MPHRAKMRVEVASVGSVNHEYRDAAVIYLSEVCQRCGFHVDQGTFYPDLEKENDGSNKESESSS